MTRYILLALILVSVISASCTGRKSKAGHKDIIPERDLITILAEVHLADGLLTIPKIRYMYADRDTLAAYNDVCEKYGYNRDQFERTMKFYFMKRPKRLIRVYDKALGILSELESRLTSEKIYEDPAAIDLWRGVTSYYFPDPSGNDTAWFDIKARATGVYTLKFTLTLYPDDQTIDPHPGVFFVFPDTLAKREREYIRTPGFIKDGQPHSYIHTVVVSGIAPTGLKGWFINHEGQNPCLYRHYKIEKIAILCTPI